MYSRTLAEDIRRDLLASPSSTVRVEELSEHEETRPEAHGAELYAPLHEYVYRASGRFIGPFPGILDMRRRATGRDFVTIGGLHLERKPLPG